MDQAYWRYLSMNSALDDTIPPYQSCIPVINSSEVKDILLIMEVPIEVNVVCVHVLWWVRYKAINVPQQVL